MVNDVLFKLELRLVAMGWPLWVSLMVSGVLGGDVSSVQTMGWLAWGSCVKLVVGGWLLEGALRSVAVR